MNGRRPPRASGRLTACALALGLAACGGSPTLPPPPVDMDQIAESYVKLGLVLGQHDTDYVDAYYGPAEWRTEAEAETLSFDAIAARARSLLSDLEGPARPPQGADEILLLRHRYLQRQISSLSARTAMLAGARLSFDEESKALYDVVAPVRDAEHFQGMLDRLEAVLPGPGPLVDRLDAFRRAYVIPPDRLDAVFTAAIDACRARTLAQVALPEGERFAVEYVTGRSWSAYNWYQGGYRSLIQVNTDLPIHIDRAIDLACHEGYPGHHVYNVLLEKHLVRDRGWIEFSIYPLFSPQSLIAEGTANFGIDVAFPGDARLEFERATLYPLAGLDPSGAARYQEVQRLVDQLGYAGNEAARRYLDGRIDGTAAADWLERYALMARPRAEQRVRFIDQYRSYVINYNYGKDLVRAYIDGRGGTADRPERRWQEFVALISSPRLPSGLE